MTLPDVKPENIFAAQREKENTLVVIGLKPTASESSKVRTLVVEEERPFLGVLTNVLQQTDRFAVVPRETGEEAVEELTRNRFDLVILAHHLPGMSGLNVLQWMHEQKLDSPVIMLTGSGSENLAAEAMKLGAYDYVSKDQFDRQHFPITASGVYERFLSRKARDREHGSMSLRGKNFASLESLRQSVSSLTLTINSTLAAISVMTEDCESLVERLAESDEKEQLQKSFVGMREEYRTVATITKSIVGFTRLIFDRLAASVDVQQDA